MPGEMSIPPEREDVEQKLKKFLIRYKVKFRDYEICPKISDIIRECIGGRIQAYETLKFSSHPSAKTLLEFSQKINVASLMAIPIEAVILAAGVEVHVIAGALVMAARDESKMKAALITMREHPEVVKMTAEVARMKTPHASKDREMMHKAVGWLPSPKGSSVNVNVFDKSRDVDGEDEDDAVSIEGVFDSDPKQLENWGESRRRLLDK
jgi:hypothetical protein